MLHEIPTWEAKIKKCSNVTLNTNMGTENKKMYKCYAKYQHEKWK